MKRILLKLAVALVTFTIGVSVAAIHWYYTLPVVIVPEVVTVPQTPSCFPGRSTRILKSTAQRDFFPPAALSEGAFSARFLNGWYSSQLEAMKELPLSALENEDESYRFLWLRSFHNPVAIHVWRVNTRHFMVVMRLNSRSDSDPGKSDLYWTRELSENEWNTFMLHLEHSEYWLMPTEEVRMLEDGAQWILEGYREGRYHVVDRQSPEAGAYRDACMFLLRQSSLLATLPAIEVY